MPAGYASIRKLKCFCAARKKKKRNKDNFWSAWVTYYQLKRLYTPEMRFLFLLSETPPAGKGNILPRILKSCEKILLLCLPSSCHTVSTRE